MLKPVAEMKLSLKKNRWTGNQWPSIEIESYQYQYREFTKVVSHLCLRFNIPVPQIIGNLEVYMADLRVNNDLIMVHMDNWTFSIATERAELRDKIFEMLRNLNVGLE